eukprot:403355311
MILSKSFRVCQSITQQSLPMRQMHTPSIRFIGPRSKTNKSIGLHDQSTASGAHQDQSHPSTHSQSLYTQQTLKALSPNCNVVYQETYHSVRLPISQEESDVINVGGWDVKDWRKIKMQ